MTTTPKPKPKPNTAAIRKVMSTIGAIGGASCSEAQNKARAINAQLGGRKPEADAVGILRKVADAIPRAKGEDKAFLIEAFTRLAPESVYTERWSTAWGAGPALDKATRRRLRGWGPNHREHARVVAARILK